MAGDKVELILSRIRTLPTLPTIIYKLLKLIESPTSTATELSEVISKDQALTARVLKLVNSSFYALRCEVVKVSHAIALLGFVAIKNLALGKEVIKERPQLLRQARAVRDLLQSPALGVFTGDHLCSALARCGFGPYLLQ